MRRDFDKSVKIPSSLVEAFAKETTMGHETWVKARENSDFSQFAPTLARLLDLSRQQAEYLGYEDTPYDALLDQYEPGMKTKEVERVFAELHTGIKTLLEVMKTAPQIEDDVLKRDYDEAQQLAFGEYVIKKLGFDFTRGRQDKAVHPFCTSFTRNDVRITTRIEKKLAAVRLDGDDPRDGPRAL